MSNNNNNNRRTTKWDDDDDEEETYSRFWTGHLQHNNNARQPSTTTNHARAPSANTMVPQFPTSTTATTMNESLRRTRTSFTPRTEHFEDEHSDHADDYQRTRQERIHQLLEMSTRNSQLRNYHDEENPELELSARQWALQDIMNLHDDSPPAGLGGDHEEEEQEPEFIDLDDLGYGTNNNNNDVDDDAAELHGFYSRALPSFNTAPATARTSYWQEEQERYQQRYYGQEESMIPHFDSSYDDDHQENHNRNRRWPRLLRGTKKPKSAFNATTNNRRRWLSGLRCSPTQSRTRLLLRGCLLVAGLGLVVAALVALAVPLLDDDNGTAIQESNNHNNNHTNFATYAPYEPEKPNIHGDDTILVATKPIPHHHHPASWDVVVSHLPNYTLPALQNIDSPQYKAVQWMANDPNLDEYLNDNDHEDTNTNNNQTTSQWRFDQRLALATIYYSLHGPRWRCHNDVCSHTQWLNYSVPECRWLQGVCTQPDGVYHYLPLQYVSGMQGGRVPPEIALLPHLRVLQLSHTDLAVDVQDLLPDELQQLQELVKVDYSHSQLTGTLPLEPLIHLHQLQEVAVNDNDLSGNPPTNLFRLRSFQRLWVHNNPRMQGQPAATTTEAPPVSAFAGGSLVAGSNPHVPLQTVPQQSSGGIRGGGGGI